MFRHTLALSLALFLPISWALQGCGLQPASNTGQATANPNGGTAPPLGPTVNRANCAAIGQTDTNGDGVCDAAAAKINAACVNNTNCISSDVPLGKTDEGFFQTGLGKITMGVFAAGALAYGGYVGGTCLSGNCDYNPFNGGNPGSGTGSGTSKGTADGSTADPAFTIDAPKYAGSHFFFGPIAGAAGTYRLTYLSDVTLQTPVKVVDKGVTSQYGSQAFSCFSSQFVVQSVTPGADAMSAIARVQLQASPTNLAHKDIDGYTRAALEKLCLTQKEGDGAWAAFNKKDGVDEYYVWSVPMGALGFQKSSVVGIRLSTSDLVFSGLTQPETTEIVFKSVPVNVGGVTTPSVSTDAICVTEDPMQLNNYSQCALTYPANATANECKIRTIFGDPAPYTVTPSTPSAVTSIASTAVTQTPGATHNSVTRTPPRTPTDTSALKMIAAHTVYSTTSTPSGLIAKLDQGLGLLMLAILAL